MNELENTLEDDRKLVQEINDAPIDMKFLLLSKIFEGAVRVKWYDEIWQTDGNPIEIINPHYLEVLGMLLKEFAENGGKLRQ